MRASSSQRGYGSRWQKARITYLARNPDCVMCGKKATVVDHIIPHKGDQQLFWDSASNWQSLCKICHDKAKAIQERKGVVIGCNLDGVPVDRSHHWHK